MRIGFGIATVFGALVLSSTAFAEGNSTPGIDRYNNNPGRQQATEVGAQCGSGAGSGAFGYFGKDNNLGITNPNGPGADGQATGQANSALCGNRQGNLP
jgi:hypothetical protein